jgi:hypothetical protein
LLLCIAAPPLDPSATEPLVDAIMELHDAILGTDLSFDLLEKFGKFETSKLNT